jgi:hypothetical protein
MEVAQNYVQWRDLVLIAFIFLFLLPEASFVNFCYYSLSFAICIVFPSIPIVCFISYHVPPNPSLTFGRKVCLHTKLHTEPVDTEIRSIYDG